MSEQKATDNSSERIWATLSEAECEAMIAIDRDGFADVMLDAFVALCDYGLAEMNLISQHKRLTDAGRAVLSQASASTNGAVGDTRPTTITVREYYRQNYIAKVAKKECTVSIPEFPGSWIEDMDEQGDLYFVRFQDYDGPHSMTYLESNPLQVTWFSQPATTQPEAVGGAGDESWKFRKLSAGVSPIDYRETLSREGLLDYLKEREATFDELYAQQRTELAAMRKHIENLHEAHEQDTTQLVAGEIARAALAEALKPFATLSGHVMTWNRDGGIVRSDEAIFYAVNDFALTYGDLRKAAAALASERATGGEKDGKRDA